eukprot:CAMPEP_0198297208 /NCGR_PEP_ID=MMETSP1449-20131203/36014_1 /TAXON_ID=420275 /ORGANISM="Attheya septentrionalis, Strain CCMP2084" /LENGTH=953 /DNA_ID=CAMNT_0043998079 /DNA_START=177 /DNA_END=3038 /DNA_ORIENTATION=-
MTTVENQNQSWDGNASTASIEFFDALDNLDVADDDIIRDVEETDKKLHNASLGQRDDAILGQISFCSTGKGSSYTSGEDKMSPLSVARSTPEPEKEMYAAKDYNVVHETRASAVSLPGNGSNKQRRETFHQQRTASYNEDAANHDLRTKSSLRLEDILGAESESLPGRVNPGESLATLPGALEPSFMATAPRLTLERSTSFDLMEYAERQKLNGTSFSDTRMGADPPTPPIGVPSSDRLASFARMLPAKPSLSSLSVTSMRLKASSNSKRHTEKELAWTTPIEVQVERSDEFTGSDEDSKPSPLSNGSIPQRFVDMEREEIMSALIPSRRDLMANATDNISLGAESDESTYSADPAETTTTESGDGVDKATRSTLAANSQDTHNKKHEGTSSDFRKSMKRSMGIRLKKKTHIPPPHVTSSPGKKGLNAVEFLPCNTVPVKSVQKKTQGSNGFFPLLMTATFQKAHKGPIWRTAFSQDGRFLATGGQDGKVILWRVAPKSKAFHGEKAETYPPWIPRDKVAKTASSSLGKDSQKSDETAPPPTTMGMAPEIGMEIEIISREPERVYSEHRGDVIDFSWSHSGFLLSASVDKTVRLWHVSKSESLHVFQHADLVTSVDFHPTQDRYFLSGGFDRKLRVWSIPDGRVKDWAQTPEAITSARYTPSGKFAVAGLFHGQVYFYGAEGLAYYTQIASKNRHGAKSMGTKVTGLAFLHTANSGVSDLAGSPSTSPTGADSTDPSTKNARSEQRRSIWSAASRFAPGKGNKRVRFTEQMLVSTNDSRLRLFGLNDYCMVRKYKGGKNNSMQIRASLSESGDYIVSGSENGRVYIWNTATKNQPLNLNITGMNKYDRSKTYESFEATRGPLPIITDASFIPGDVFKEAILTSGLFPSLSTLDHVPEDWSSSCILTTDYDGNIRVFLRKKCLDNVFRAAGPEGYKHRDSENDCGVDNHGVPMD